MEIWKDVAGYEGLYQISTFGRVKSLPKNGRDAKILKPSKTIWGYLDIQLCKNGKYHHERIHRLVASAFLPNPNKLPQVNHKDFDRTNNQVNNLEWCSTSENYWYSRTNNRGNSRPSHLVKCIETDREYQSAVDAARDYKVTPCAIRNACIGRHKTCCGLHWQYI